MTGSTGAYHIEVRRPLHMRRPTATRWRRRKRAEAESLRDGPPFDTMAHAVDDLGDLFFQIIFFVVVTALLLLIPWGFTLIAMLVESVVWIAAITAGVVAVRVLRRPYIVTVLESSTGTVLAKAQVPGRAAAETHAAVVASRLGEGLTPAEAVAMHPAPA